MPLVRVIWLFPFEAFNAIFALMLSLVASNLAWSNKRRMRTRKESEKERKERKRKREGEKRTCFDFITNFRHDLQDRRGPSLFIGLVGRKKHEIAIRSLDPEAHLEFLLRGGVQHQHSRPVQFHSPYQKLLSILIWMRGKISILVGIPESERGRAGERNSEKRRVRGKIMGIR